MSRGEACWDILAEELEEKGEEGRLRRDAEDESACRKSWKMIVVGRKLDDDGGGQDGDGQGEAGAGARRGQRQREPVLACLGQKHDSNGKSL